MQCIQISSIRASQDTVYTLPCIAGGGNPAVAGCSHRAGHQHEEQAAEQERIFNGHGH